MPWKPAANADFQVAPPVGRLMGGWRTLQQACVDMGLGASLSDRCQLTWRLAAERCGLSGPLATAHWVPQWHLTLTTLPPEPSGKPSASPLMSLHAYD